MNSAESFRRQTKIVGTIGPACRSREQMGELIQAGLDVARLHFSYGGQDEHAENIQRLRLAAGDAGQDIAILQDLCGTKIRMQRFAQDDARLEVGSTFTLTSRETDGNGSEVSINIPELMSIVEPGERILLNDGALELKAIEVADSDIRCEVVRGGRIKAGQSVHVPGKAPPVRVPTDKDLDDVRFGLREGVDWIALSYASRAEEVRNLRDFIRGQGADTPVMVKIERKDALVDLDNLIDAADGVMVARGDLGMEIPLERIGLVQKDIIRRANAAAKPVVTATEMLISMLDQATPTRAEVTDITNAILDGTDAVMLSGETAVGRYAREAVATMARVAETADAEASRVFDMAARSAATKIGPDEALAMAKGACRAARELRAKLIVCRTHGGHMARLVSAQRPGIPIMVESDSRATLRRCLMNRGVILCPTCGSEKENVSTAWPSLKKWILETEMARTGESIVVIGSRHGHDGQDAYYIEAEKI